MQGLLHAGGRPAALLGGSLAAGLAASSNPPRSSHAARPKPLFVKEVALSEFRALSARDLEGRPFPFSQLEGKAVLILNVVPTAKTRLSHYTELKEMHARYAQRGLEIVAFLCENRNRKEPGDPAELRRHWGRSATGFRIMEEASMSPPDKHSVYGLLKQGGQPVRWNFYSKFLVACRGERCSVRVFDGVTAEALSADIEDALAEAE